MDTYGFAECCCRAPELGYFDPKMAGAPMARCPACKREQGVIGGFNAVRRYWNALLWAPKPDALPLPEPRLCGMALGWRPCRFRIELARFGHTDEEEAEGAFLTNRSLAAICGTSYDGRHLEHVELELWPSRRRLTLNWPRKKRWPYSTIGVSLYGDFDKAFTVDIYSTRLREHDELMAWLDGAGKEAK